MYKFLNFLSPFKWAAAQTIATQFQDVDMGALISNKVYAQKY